MLIISLEVLGIYGSFVLFSVALRPNAGHDLLLLEVS